MSAAIEPDLPSPALRRWRDAQELLSSMRFAITLLTVICIASVIGTVLKQQEPFGNYVNQFGPFWADVFGRLDLYKVYSAWWFLLILAFLVTSTSLCIARNTPKILADLRSYKENIREQALAAFHHRAESTLPQPPEPAAQALGHHLAASGWKVRLQQRDTSGWMIAAKAGAANKWGYLAAHSAIVLICLGGLLDGDLIVRAQMWMGGKTPYRGGGMVADVAPEHRLGERNPTFRGNLLVAEGTQSSTAILNQSDGVVLQDLPFAVELKKFIVEYYPTGMPKLFASDIVIHDRVTGEQQAARVEVNHPVSYHGIEIYQSSFDDGGSAVHLRAQPINGVGKRFELDGVIGGSSRLNKGDDSLTVEYTGLRVINVENLANASNASGSGSGADVRKVDLTSALDRHLGAAARPEASKGLRNVGPSFSYKLRDAAGQAREFNNYMLPLDLGDGLPVFLLGMRENPDEPFRYLRVPSDAQGSMDDFFRLRAALDDAALRGEAARRYAVKVIDPSRKDLIPQLAASAQRALALFAGAEHVTGSTAPGGLQAVSDFMERTVAEPERNRAGEMLIRLLNGTLFELMQMGRQRAGLAPLPTDARTQSFMSLSVMALSDSYVYPAPFTLQLADFKQVQASVFQVTRTPGKIVVYAGCFFLILGVFAMLYVRERRLWIWISPATDGQGSQARMALSTNRKTLDADREFDQLRARLLNDKESS
jgi:cytochrome c biogenesis protein